MNSSSSDAKRGEKGRKEGRIHLMTTKKLIKK
jgi:hypothetical protein